MGNKNYELYKQNKTYIFNIVCDILDRTPMPFSFEIFPFCLINEDEKTKLEESNKEFLKNEIPILERKLKNIGFEFRENE